MVLKIFQKPFLGPGFVVDNALACHLCGPGSNQGHGMRQGSGHAPMQVLWFPPKVLQFPPPHLTT